MQTSSGVPQGKIKTRPLDWPAGGRMIRNRIALDGWHFAGGDQLTPFLRAPGARVWTSALVGGVNYDDTKFTFTNGNYGLDICYGDSRYLASVCMHSLWTSADRGGSWTWRKMIYANVGDCKEAANTLAIDPANGLNIALWNPDTKRFETSTDGGATFTVHPDIPAADPTVQAGFGLVAFDRSSSTSGGYTHRLYVLAPGHGLYRLTDGFGSSASASTVQLVSASVTGANSLEVMTYNGRAFWANGAINYVEAAGTAITTIARDAQYITCHPTLGEAWFVNGGGSMGGSSDGGSNWSNQSGAIVHTGDDAPFGPWTNEGYATAGPIAIDPTDGALWFAEGIGMWKWPSPATDGSTPTVDFISRQITMMVGRLSNRDPVHGCTVTGGDDRSWKIDRPEKKGWYNMRHGPGLFPFNIEIVHAGGFSWGKGTDADHDFGAGVAFSMPFMTYDRGRSFAPMFPAITDNQDNNWQFPLDFTTMPGVLFGLQPLWGQITCGRAGRAVWNPFQARPMFFKNGVWKAVPFGAAGDAAFTVRGGDGDLSVARGLFSYYYGAARLGIVCDDANPDKFLILWTRNGQNVDNAKSQAVAGVWEFDIEAETCTRISSYTGIANVDMLGEGPILKQVPGHPTDFFLATMDGQNFPTLFSNDRCLTWRTATGCPIAVGIGFRKNLPGAAYPRITVAKEARGQYDCLNWDRVNSQGTFTQFENLLGGTNGGLAQMGNDMYGDFGSGNFASGPSGGFEQEYEYLLKVA